MERVILKVINEIGLHARPAATFAKCASGFASEITIARVSAPDTKKSGKALMGIMMMGIKNGEEIIVEANGEDEAKAIAEIKALVESGCGE